MLNLFGWSQRDRLVKQGLASERTRRQVPTSEWRELLETCFLSKVGLLTAIGAGLGVIATWGDMPPNDEIFSFVAMGLALTASLLVVPFKYGDLADRHSKLLLVCTMVLLQLAGTKAILLMDHAGAVWSGVPVGPFMAPFAFAPLVVTALLGVGPGVFATLVVTVLSAVLHPFSTPDASILLVMGLVVGMTTVVLARNIRKRGHFIRAGMWVGLVSFAATLVLGSLLGLETKVVLGEAIWSALIMMALGFLANALQPVLESLFGIVTNVSWLELADLNHPLLRRMTLEAPGTYHHSLIVAHLAEAAAQTVGASAEQCRVCALFHDIGKLVKPGYFVENQGVGENPHDDLAPSMSALIVIAHIKEGIDLALKYKLPAPIIDAIREHHGTTKAAYFYAKALRQQKDAKAGCSLTNMRVDDVPAVSEESFRYPGPKPQTAETAILMIADAVESASRTLEKPTPKNLEDLVDGIIQARINERQLDECPLSIRDLRVVGERLAFTLKTMMHARIAYPKEEPSDKPEKADRDRDKDKLDQPSKGVPAAAGKAATPV